MFAGPLTTIRKPTPPHTHKQQQEPRAIRVREACARCAMGAAAGVLLTGVAMLVLFKPPGDAPPRAHACGDRGGVVAEYGRFDRVWDWHQRL